MKQHSKSTEYGGSKKGYILEGASGMRRLWGWGEGGRRGGCEVFMLLCVLQAEVLLRGSPENMEWEIFGDGSVDGYGVCDDCEHDKNNKNGDEYNSMKADCISRKETSDNHDDYHSELQDNGEDNTLNILTSESTHS